MGAIGGIAQGGRAFLLGNLDYPALSVRWVPPATDSKGYPYFALLAPGRQGVGAGLNAAGLGLLSSPEIEGHSLFGEVLAFCATVAEGIEGLRQIPVGGLAMLAARGQIALVERTGDQLQTEILDQGILVRVTGLRDSAIRRDRLEEFLQEVYAWFPALDSDDLVERCRKALRQEPVLDSSTRLSVAIDAQEKRVDYLVGGGRWQTRWLEEIG